MDPIMHNGKVSSECSMAIRSIGLIRSARGRGAHRSRFLRFGRMLAMMASSNGDTPHPWLNGAKQGDHDGFHVTGLPQDHLWMQLYMSDTCGLGLNRTSGPDWPGYQRAKQTQLCQNGRQVPVRAGPKARKRSHRRASAGYKARERSHRTRSGASVQRANEAIKPGSVAWPARERGHQPGGLRKARERSGHVGI